MMLARWDWYAATVPCAEEELLASLVVAGDLLSVRDARPMHGYQHAAEVHRGDTRCALVMWGGNAETVHVVGTGEHAEPVATVVRQCWPGHRVTRADSAVDLAGPGIWDFMEDLALRVADDRGLKVQHMGDYHRQEDGRTLYVGGRTCAARMRFYEKGKQLGGEPDWCRAELVCRPATREGKEHLAGLAPVEAWGCSPSAREVAAALGSDDLDPWRVHKGTDVQDSQRARRAVVEQYRRVLSAWADELGSWEALGLVLGEKVRELG